MFYLFFHQIIYFRFLILNLSDQRFYSIVFFCYLFILLVLITCDESFSVTMSISSRVAETNAAMHLWEKFYWFETLEVVFICFSDFLLEKTIINFFSFSKLLIIFDFGGSLPFQLCFSSCLEISNFYYCWLNNFI